MVRPTPDFHSPLGGPPVRPAADTAPHRLRFSAGRGVAENPQKIRLRKFFDVCFLYFAIYVIFPPKKMISNLSMCNLFSFTPTFVPDLRGAFSNLPWDLAHHPAEVFNMRRSIPSSAALAATALLGMALASATAKADPFFYTGAIVDWVVPTTGTYSVAATGAAGGFSTRGRYPGVNAEARFLKSAG